ncbi:hypothetical protein [Aestuariivita sp.]|jgi:hypothetical protein|uniref:hypothetical protein n=1 Tax=Aestuariivita sp. TaxID=1872407 RepID=UPI00216F8063|nr:hypothetical protein [Aestuariivita sp.]MCE8008516.1 hypothetical protein [Aestuariivita sp.]
MRVALLFAVLAAGPAHAEWFCQSALAVAPDSAPISEFGLELTMDATGQFRAEGVQTSGPFEYPLVWTGTYTRFDDQLALIGPLQSDGWVQRFETRALTRHMQEDVMILTVSDTPADTVTLRCLRHDLR